MHLTEEGAFLFDHAREILHRMEDLEERLTCRRGPPGGRLRITIATAFMLYAIVPDIGTDIAIRVSPLSDPPCVRARWARSSSMWSRAPTTSPAIAGQPARKGSQGTR